MPPKTKADTAIFLLGQPASALHPEFIEAVEKDGPSVGGLLFKGPCQLPTRKQVLMLYFFLREQVGRKNSHVSKHAMEGHVAGHVIKYWKMAGFKTMVLPRVEKHIMNLVEEQKTITKKKGKTSEFIKQQREDYLQSLKHLFDVATPDLENILQKDRLLQKDDNDKRYRVEEGYTRKIEDINFLNDQRGDRKMVMDDRDLGYEERLVANQSRKISTATVQSGVTSSQASEGSVRILENESGDEVSENEDNNDNFTCKGKFKKKETVLVELPRDIMNSPTVVAMLDRTGQTSRTAVGLVSTLLKTGKVDGKETDLSEFILSPSTAERKRAHSRSVLMEQAITEFEQKKPDKAALHWDGKLIADVSGVLQENEAILVSGSPHYIEGKLLGVAKLVDDDGNPTSTGEAQAGAVIDQLRQWGVADNIVALVFDTTASNTGKHRGATVRIEKFLARPVFYLGCRHHVSELVIKACWYSLFEADLSPDCQFFVRIKEEWPSFDTSSEAEITTLDMDTPGKERALEFLKMLLAMKNKRNEMLVRDDYRELAECAMIVLGELPPSGKIVWRKPGACHKARFCSFGIYSLKALTFSKQLELDRDTVTALIKFCRFTTVVYIPYFLASSIGSDSTVNDLALYQQLFAYRNINQTLADEALVVLRRHGWYLTPDVALFSLFSSKVSEDEKSRIASKLLTYQNKIPETFKLGKPAFPVIDKKTKLVDLVSPLSYRFFKILNNDYGWLNRDPKDWEADERYQSARDFVITVKVTNDVAERGVKMAIDYATLLTKDDKMRDMILQGVEKSRRSFPDMRKKTLNVGS